MWLNTLDGKIAHAEIKIGRALVMLSDEASEPNDLSPQSIGGSPVKIHMYVEDVDPVFRQAVAAGARVLIPVSDHSYGDRGGPLQDPFVHIWMVSTH